MKKIFAFVFALSALVSSAQDKPSYLIYDAKGKKVSYKKMIHVLQEKELVLFGELHDNPISHWLELEVIMDLSKLKKLVLGAEMFEADNQKALDLYLKDSIDQKGLDTLARLWKNYRTDYKPIVDFAKQQQVSVVASNIPRRYASLVNKKGFEALDTLSIKEKSWIAPLPIPFDPQLPTYKNIMTMMGDHGTAGIVKAQASKDATMAYFISRNLKPGYLFVHINGAYHSDYYEGILWYIKKQKPLLNSATISTVEQADVFSLVEENKGKADFIIVINERVTKTF